MYIGKENDLDKVYEPQYDLETKSWHVGNSHERVAEAYATHFEHLDPEMEVPAEKIRELRSILKDAELASEIAGFMALSTMIGIDKDSDEVDPLIFAKQTSSLALHSYRVVTEHINPCEDDWPEGVSEPGVWIEGMELAAKTLSDKEVLTGSTKGEEVVLTPNFVNGTFSRLIAGVIESWDGEITE